MGSVLTLLQPRKASVFDLRRKQPSACLSCAAVGFALLDYLVGGLATLILATFAILKLGLRMPLKYFFGATRTLLYIVAFIFAGNGIKELQAALWLPATPLSFPSQLPILGIYPTVETLAAQGAMVLAFVITSFWLARERQRAA